MSTDQKSSKTSQLTTLVKAVVIVASILGIVLIAIKISTPLSWIQVFAAVFSLIAVVGTVYASFTGWRRNRRNKPEGMSEPQATSREQEAKGSEKQPEMKIVPYDMSRPVPPIRPKPYENILHWLEVAWLPLVPVVLIAVPLTIVLLGLRAEFWLFVLINWAMLPYITYSSWRKWAYRPYSCNTEDLLLNISEKGLLFFVRNSSNDPISLKECTFESGGQSLVEQILDKYGSSSQTLTIYQGGKPVRKPIRHFRDLDDLLAIQTWWHAQVRYEAKMATYLNIAIERNTREIADFFGAMSPKQIAKLKASLDADDEGTEEE